MDDAGSELESLDENNKPPRPAPKPKGEKRDPNVNPRKVEQKTEGEELEDISGEGTPPEQPPPAEQQPDPARMGARDLRKAYEGSQKKIRDELQPELTRLRSRVQELESAAPAQPNEAEVSRVKAIETRNAELEEHIRFVDYKESKEFKDKYWQPYVEAWERCQADLKELNVEVPDGKGGFITRPATDDDIMLLAGLPLGERLARANAMFGDVGRDMADHARRLKDLNEAQNKALGEAKKNAGERSKLLQEQAQTNSRADHQMWVDSVKALGERFPKWFASTEGDVEGNRHLAAGYAMTNYLFNGKLTPEEIALLPKGFREEMEANGKLSRQSQIRLHALIRMKAAGHDRQVYRAQQLLRENNELKKKLAGYEASEPPVGGGRQPRSAGGKDYGNIEDANSELDELSRRGP
jgi:hypothetical protein